MEKIMETVDLRPMTLGELLDRTFHLYRGHFLLFVSIMAIPAAFSVPANVLLLTAEGPFLSSAFANPGRPPAAPDLGFLAGIFFASGVLFILFVLIYALAVAAASCAVADVYLGRTISMRGAYGRLRGKFWRLMGVVANIAIRVFGLIVLVFVVAAGIGAGFAFLSSSAFAPNNPIAPLLVGLSVFACYIGAFALGVYLALRYAVSIPVLMLENLGVLATIRRSVSLTRGRRGHIFLTLLVAVVIAYVGVMIFQMPFSIAMMLALARGHWPSWLAFASSISGAIGSSLTGPVFMIAIVLLYYDTRIRKEGFDLQYMMSALDNPPTPAVAAPETVS
jgi:Membrane domain of glycerophosphoryl diester phosphodiesterase